ncbi:hypothetical protein B0J17DRAFT_411799 [Rhizoctonia solani]|nr:hypothetical protein B0J17DRAFT_411799 [Rhizoctonia solani]
MVSDKGPVYSPLFRSARGFNYFAPRDTPAFNQERSVTLDDANSQSAIGYFPPPRPLTPPSDDLPRSTHPGPTSQNPLAFTHRVSYRDNTLYTPMSSVIAVPLDSPEAEGDKARQNALHGTTSVDMLPTPPPSRGSLACFGHSEVGIRDVPNTTISSHRFSPSSLISKARRLLPRLRSSHKVPLQQSPRSGMREESIPPVGGHESFLSVASTQSLSHTSSPFLFNDSNLELRELCVSEETYRITLPQSHEVTPVPLLPSAVPAQEPSTLVGAFSSTLTTASHCSRPSSPCPTLSAGPLLSLRSGSSDLLSDSNSERFNSPVTSPSPVPSSSVHPHKSNAWSPASEAHECSIPLYLSPVRPLSLPLLPHSQTASDASSPLTDARKSFSPSPAVGTDLYSPALLSHLWLDNLLVKPEEGRSLKETLQPSYKLSLEGYDAASARSCSRTPLQEPSIVTSKLPSISTPTTGPCSTSPSTHLASCTCPSPGSDPFGIRPTDQINDGERGNQLWGLLVSRWQTELDSRLVSSLVPPSPTLTLVGPSTIPCPQLSALYTGSFRLSSSICSPKYSTRILAPRVLELPIVSGSLLLRSLPARKILRTASSAASASKLFSPALNTASRCLALLALSLSRSAVEPSDCSLKETNLIALYCLPKVLTQLWTRTIFSQEPLSSNLHVVCCDWPVHIGYTQVCELTDRIRYSFSLSSRT